MGLPRSAPHSRPHNPARGVPTGPDSTLDPSRAHPVQGLVLLRGHWSTGALGVPDSRACRDSAGPWGARGPGRDPVRRNSRLYYSGRIRFAPRAASRCLAGPPAACVGVARIAPAARSVATSQPSTPLAPSASLAPQPRLPSPRPSSHPRPPRVCACSGAGLHVRGPGAARAFLRLFLGPAGTDPKRGPEGPMEPRAGTGRDDEGPG